MPKKTITFGKENISIEEIIKISNHFLPVGVTLDKTHLKTIQLSNQFLNDVLEKEENIYGVTTGFGESCTVDIPPSLIKELPKHLTRFHGCGLGDYFTESEGRAIMAVRLASLAKGHSGARIEILKRIIVYLNKKITPIIPQEGSVGASGDLTPLSYLAASIMGERKVYFKNKIHSTNRILKQLKIKPLELKPKEALALMNGTSVMTAIACFAYDRANYLSKLSSRITAMMVMAMMGNPNHFEEDLFLHKPYPGQSKVAKRIEKDLKSFHANKNNRIQDRYSLRCAPHVIGVMEDALPWIKNHIEIEMNSSNDNPIIDGRKKKIMHGGHFYGGHIAFAMDSLKNCIANIADLLDRQIALLLDSSINKGLPKNLTAAKGQRKSINHGFKAIQIAASAWAAEALKLTMPASVFSRSTESHNQDKVSMGTIASRDCMRVLQLTEQVAAAALLASKQALNIRFENNEIEKKSFDKNIKLFINQIEKISPIVREDREMEEELRDIIKNIQIKKWELEN